MYTPALKTCRNIIENIILLLSILTFSSLVSAKELTELQNQARLYRTQGMESQHAGNLDMAMVFYQKAIQLDPLYAVAYNDVGIIYEARGEPEQAQECYLKAIQVDPRYLSPYSNLALLYENKRDLTNAAFYWSRRVELGSANDSWRQRAKKRLADIQTVLGGENVDLREEEIINLMEDVVISKSVSKPDDKALARTYLEKAKLYYKNGNDVEALKTAADAKSLDPDNRKIDDFIDKVKVRLLSN